MHLNRALEQHIAVFGESGSGKTVLISSFYGAAQEPAFMKQSLFGVVAEQTSQGTRLHQNYLGMKNARRLPEPNRFAATSYSFAVKLKDAAEPKAMKGKPFDALRLVWHDYPGEWFEEDPSGPEEVQRRTDTFKALVASDVALLLVDGQKLLDHAGEEERYLKALFTTFRTGLAPLKDAMVDDAAPLVRFPRIWTIALSKSDLLPDLDVFALRDLVVEKVGGEIEELRKVIAGLVDGSDALSVGEDYVLLSSAKFAAGQIEVSERVGLDLVLPMAAVLPFERHAKWAKLANMPGKVVEHLLTSKLVTGAGAMAAAKILGKVKVPGPAAHLLSLLKGDHLSAALLLAGDKLKEINAEARLKEDNLTAVLTGFRMDLESGEADKVFLKSQV